MSADVGLALGAEIPVAGDALDLCAWTGRRLRGQLATAQHPSSALPSVPASTAARRI